VCAALHKRESNFETDFRNFPQKCSGVHVGMKITRKDMNLANFRRILEDGESFIGVVLEIK
jgi:hypothetical protein